MIMNLNANEFLRLTQARGATIEVLDGRVWITEPGRERDAVVTRGMQYSVAGDGLVVLGTDAAPAGATRIALQPPVWRRLWLQLRLFAGAVIGDMRARLTVAELEQLSDRTLRDIGLTRDQIEHAVRRRNHY
jgi:uncharacterized protein YjiS (DUF1127 family)